MHHGHLEQGLERRRDRTAWIVDRMLKASGFFDKRKRDCPFCHHYIYIYLSPFSKGDDTIILPFEKYFIAKEPAVCKSSRISSNLISLG